ncbi:hypothetical protein ACWCQL_36730 [Streptomyces sp. NPDC002073]
MTHRTAAQPDRRETAVRVFVDGRPYGQPIIRTLAGGGVDRTAPVLGRYLGLPRGALPLRCVYFFGNQCCT